MSIYHANFCAFLDSARSWQTNFQDPATPIMEGLIDLHHHIFFFLIIILVFVLWLVLSVLFYFHIYPTYITESNLNFPNEDIEDQKAYTKYIVPKFLNKWVSLNKITHNYVLEIVWTLIPSFVLILIAIPSFALLYAMDEVISPAITLKIIGHQWYWSYEYSDYYLSLLSSSNSSLNFDSFMIPEDELRKGQLRLLEVDNPVVLPIKTHVRVIVTAADVLHSWAVPSLGVKMDAVPGRLNQASLFIKRPGVYYGQCSEICGIHHGFMPIVVEALPLSKYITWISTKLEG